MASGTQYIATSVPTPCCTITFSLNGIACQVWCYYNCYTSFSVIYSTAEYYCIAWPLSCLLVSKHKSQCVHVIRCQQNKK